MAHLVPASAGRDVFSLLLKVSSIRSDEQNEAGSQFNIVGPLRVCLLFAERILFSSYRVILHGVPKKLNLSINFAITSVNVHRF